MRITGVVLALMLCLVPETIHASSNEDTLHSQFSHLYALLYAQVGKKDVHTLAQMVTSDFHAVGFPKKIEFNREQWLAYHKKMRKRFTLTRYQAKITITRLRVVEKETFSFGNPGDQHVHAKSARIDLAVRASYLLNGVPKLRQAQLEDTWIDTPDGWKMKRSVLCTVKHISDREELR